MPVDQAGLFDMVLDPNAKRLADVGGDPGCSVGLADAKYGCAPVNEYFMRAVSKA
jgi:hypothetical protein